MPKNFRNGNTRGRGGRNNGGDRFYDASEVINRGHDDRTERGGDWNDRNRNDRNMTNVQRRVSFKPFNGGRGKGRITENQMRAHFNDDDEAMGGDTFDSGSAPGRLNNRFINRQRRSGSPIPRGVSNGGNLSKKLFKPTNSNWFEVKIPYGHKYEKDFILRSIQQKLSPMVFIPLYYKTGEFAATFYVEGFQVATAIQQASRTIECPDGRRLTLNVRNNQPPTQMNEQLKSRMKQAMVKRYNPHTKALDLAKFHADPDLSDIFCALARPQIMLAAIDIIAEHIPELQALNLNENRLYMLDHMKSMANKLPHLKILHLAKNRIPYLTTLDSLKNLKLVELNLEDNPLRKQFDDNTSYIRNRASGSELQVFLPPFNTCIVWCCVLVLPVQDKYLDGMMHPCSSGGRRQQSDEQETHWFGHRTQFCSECVAHIRRAQRQNIKLALCKCDH